jgi:hypothetical protein
MGVEGSGDGRRRRARKTTEQQIAECEARLRKLRSKQSAESRKQRNHVIMLMGGMLAKCFPGGVETIDFEKLDAYLTKYGYAIARCTHEPASLDDEYAQARAFEEAHRARRDRPAGNAGGAEPPLG